MMITTPAACLPLVTRVDLICVLHSGRWHSQKASIRTVSSSHVNSSKSRVKLRAHETGSHTIVGVYMSTFCYYLARLACLYLSGP